MKWPIINGLTTRSALKMCTNDAFMIGYLSDKIRRIIRVIYTYIINNSTLAVFNHQTASLWNIKTTAYLLFLIYPYAL